MVSYKILNSGNASSSPLRAESKRSSMAFRILSVMLICLMAAGSLFAQLTKDPTTWKVEAIKKQGNEYEIKFKLALDKNWHIWSLKPGGDGYKFRLRLNLIQMTL
jgi:hypothetical protein